jgi:hypothetical protein
MVILGRADVNGNVIVDDDVDEDTDVEMTTDMGHSQSPWDEN